MQCQYNTGSYDSPIKCTEKANIKFIMDGKLSDTCLCKTHAIYADNSSIVKIHLIERQIT